MNSVRVRMFVFLISAPADLIMQLAFTSRVRLYTSWQHADSDVRKIQQAHEKARRQGRIPSDRLSISLAEIAEVRHTF